MANLTDICVARKILSSEYQPYACGKISPRRISTKFSDLWKGTKKPIQSEIAFEIGKNVALGENDRKPDPDGDFDPKKRERQQTRFKVIPFMLFSSPDKKWLFYRCLPLLAFLIGLFLIVTPTPWAEDLEAEWGGHLRLRADGAWPDSHATLAFSGTDPLVDGEADFRLKNHLFWGENIDLDTHYEFIATGGDTRKRTASLAASVVPAMFLSSSATVNDRRRLFDLTAVVDESNDHLAYHRLDRLALTLRTSRATLTLGRQALTWGNGLVFNPMDLFNPFAPTDTDRDYKVGDDMALVRIPESPVGDLQLLYVPRRDALTREVSWNASSLAAKIHRSVGTTEFDLLAARHYRDYVLGVGAAGYLADAAWRMDGTWTRRFGGAGRSNLFSFVANMDYSWIWGGKNWYGLMEVYFSGMGSDDPVAALTDPVLLERLDRGEAFTLGRTYLATQVQYEAHPLVNLYLCAINEISTPSGLLQPRAVWDAAQNLQITLGGALYWGSADTEFGGFQPVAGGPWIHSADSAYLKMSIYF